MGGIEIYTVYRVLAIQAYFTDGLLKYMHYADNDISGVALRKDTVCESNM